MQSLFEQTVPSLGLSYTPDPARRPRLETYQRRPRHTLESLLQQPSETLQALFIALTASAIGSWTTSALDNPAEDEFALTLAGHLGAAVSPTAVSDDWLKTLSKERLTEVYVEISQTPLVGSFTSKQLRGLILERLKSKADYLPKELTFYCESKLLPPTDEEQAADQLEDGLEGMEETDSELESAA